MFCLSKLCYLCLGTYKNLKLVLSEKSDGRLIQKELNYCLPEIVDHHSHIPKYICSNCTNKLHCFYKFKQTSLRSNKYLKSSCQTLTSADTGESYKHLSVTLTDIKYQNKLQALSSDQTLPTAGSNEELPTGENLDNGMCIEETVLNSEIQYVALLDTGLFEEENDIVVKAELLTSENNADNEYYQEYVNSIKCESVSSEDSEDSNSGSDENDPTNPEEMEVIEKRRKLQCKICSKEYFYKKSLENHLKDHADNNSTSNDSTERRHKCRDCPRAFTFPSELERHTGIHSGERPFKCQTCQKSFTQAAHLKQHKLTHTGERPHECDVCHKTFNQKSSLTVHKRTHDNNRPYQCTHCNYTCTYAGNLSSHIRVHTGEKPYHCHMCPYKCARASDLKKHIRTHC